MMKFLFALFLVAGTAHASYFENMTDSAETANAMAHCPAETSKLLQGREYVATVEGTFNQVSPKVSTKTYKITSRTGGGFELIRSGAVMTVAVMVTQPADGLMDAPSKTEWTCGIVR